MTAGPRVRWKVISYQSFAYDALNGGYWIRTTVGLADSTEMLETEPIINSKIK